MTPIEKILENIFNHYAPEDKRYSKAQQEILALIPKDEVITEETFDDSYVPNKEWVRKTVQNLTLANVRRAMGGGDEKGK